MRLSKARNEFVTAMMKDTIFEAADSVLQQHGVGGITMDRVATTAGLAKASLYNYFEDKDDLLRFVYARLVEPFFPAMEDIAYGDLPAPRKLEKMLGMALEHSEKHKGVIRLLAELGQETQRDQERYSPAFLQLLTSIFEQESRKEHFVRIIRCIRPACFSGVYRNCSRCG